MFQVHAIYLLTKSLCFRRSLFTEHKIGDQPAKVLGAYRHVAQGLSDGPEQFTGKRSRTKGKTATVHREQRQN